MYSAVICDDYIYSTKCVHDIVTDLTHYLDILRQIPKNAISYSLLNNPYRTSSTAEIKNFLNKYVISKRSITNSITKNYIIALNSILNYSHDEMLIAIINAHKQLLDKVCIDVYNIAHSLEQHMIELYKTEKGDPMSTLMFRSFKRRCDLSKCYKIFNEHIEPLSFIVQISDRRGNDDSVELMKIYINVFNIITSLITLLSKTYRDQLSLANKNEFRMLYIDSDLLKLFSKNALFDLITNEYHRKNKTLVMTDVDFEEYKQFHNVDTNCLNVVTIK